ncbi:MAG: hypothetical protein M3505_10160 [Verrucomicrobiota bacterium]|nr:hypothetical protein [Verrucomicrobiota bacterium]
MAASTVAQYLAALPADRRATLSAVRKVINENLPDGYEEGMQFGPRGPSWARERAAPRSRQEVRGEEGETKEVTLAAAFSQK